MIKPPTSPGAYPDRHLECQEALEPLVISLIEQGRAAGWTLAEITTALIDVADHQMLADEANRRVDQAIEETLRRLGL